MKERFEQLHTIRGLAAVSVLFSHLLLIPASVSPTASKWLYSASSPLTFFTKGHEAVIFFFILSGFVLSLPLLDGSRPPYFPYLIRRFFRIYVPYVVAFGIGAIALLLTPKVQSASWSDLANATWTRNLSPGDIAGHLIGIGYFDNRPLNGVIWSLVHEMRISIVFPFVVLLLLKVRWPYALAVGVLLSGLSTVNLIYNLQTDTGLSMSYYDSLHYLSFFIVGMLLARHRKALVRRFAGCRIGTKAAVLAGAFGLYTYSAYGLNALRKIGLETSVASLVQDYVIAAGVAAFIVVALGSRRVGSALQHKAGLFLGNISYSLYLYHLMVIVALLHLLEGKVPLLGILALSGVLSVAIAWLGYEWVEKPSMAWGKRWSTRAAQAARSAEVPVQG